VNRTLGLRKAATVVWPCERHHDAEAQTPRCPSYLTLAIALPAPASHPCSSFELPANLLLLDPAPLLEEERYAGAEALVLNVHHPRRTAKPRTRPGLAARNYPVNPAQLQSTQWPE
jgi:hypothetical protein